MLPSARPTTALACAAALLAAASGAAAQCDWHVLNVPDFDQRRQDTPSVNGLPGDGSMYCVPTSECNWLGYIANHGYPNVFSGPRTWQSSANYNYITGRDAYLGTLMSTSATGGTGGSGWYSGLVVYLLLTAPFKFDVTEEYSSPSDFTLFVDHFLGGLSCMGYGRYTLDSAGHYTRNGGHVITLTGMKNLCSAGQTVFRFRDPADDGTNTTQSNFATADVPMQAVTASFRGGSGDPYQTLTLMKFTSYSSNAFLDGVVTIWPVFGLTTGSSNLVDTLRLLRPVQLDTMPAPVMQDFSTPTGGNIRDLVMHPQMHTFYYITGPAGVNPTRLLKFDPSNGTSTPLGGTLLTNPTRLATSRQGELFALDGTMIYEVPGTPGATAPPSTDSQGVDTLTFDDFTDLLVGLDTGRQMIYQWHRGFVGGFGVIPLPAGVCLSGRAWITISPADGSLWLASGQCPTIYKLVGGNPLTIADMVPLPPGTTPAGLNVTRHGHVLFSSNGHPVEMAKVNGVWVTVPNSDFAGLDSGPFLYLSRSRSNFDPATMNGPGYNNLVDPEVLPEVVDCYANCDGSTSAPVLNVNDFVCFQAMFAAGRPEANCDESTGVPLLNVNDFVCFQGKFAAGCP